MFVSLDEAAWPSPGQVRDLRVSLNAPVVLGLEARPAATRAAIGWIPAPGAEARVRLWLRAEGSSGPTELVRAFDLPERPLGPAARATALERAECFLGGLGFLFADASRSLPAPGSALGDLLRPPSRTSDPDPDTEPDAPGAGAAIRADVRLTKFRRRGPGPSSGAPAPTGPSAG